MTGIKVGDLVQPRNPAAMLELCETYHLGIEHGTVIDIWPEYAATIIVQWQEQRITYMLPPSVLRIYEEATR